MSRILFMFFAAACAAHAGPIQPGDRIAIIGNTFADQLRIHGYFETQLLLRTPDNPVSVRNLGWAGDMLPLRDRPTNFPLETSTLEAHKTDVIIACFGMGESFAGEAGLPDFRKDLMAFLDAHRGKRYNGTSPVRLVLVSPIAYEDHGKRTPNLERRNRELEQYTQVMAVVAAERKIPFVNLYAPTAELMRTNQGPKWTTNGIHLNARGYARVGVELADSLLAGNGPWRITVDAASQTTQCEGVEATKIKVDSAGITFSVREQSAPPGEDQLIVKHLKPGHYRLEIDGQAIVSASHEQWAEGVAINGSPAHRAVDAYRERVNDKNLQFLYGWKALNQVHIVGERRKSNSGKALPAELIKFNELANQRDSELKSGVPLTTRTWRLVLTKDAS